MIDVVKENKIFILLLFLPALLCFEVRAQYYFDKLTEEDGLSDNRITCFLKDKTGFLWIGTKNGLNRYDGHSFRVFRPGPGNSISNEEINDIVQDSSGRIWIATLMGINIYDPLTDKWETMLPVGSNERNDLPSYIIWDLYVDEKNHIWIASDVWELSVYDPSLKTFKYYDWPAAHQTSAFAKFPRYRSIQRIARKDSDEFWLATSIGLFSVNTVSSEFSFYGGGYGDSNRDLYYDSKNKMIYLVTQGGLIFTYNEKEKLYKELKATPAAYPSTSWKKEEQKDNKLLMGHPSGLLEIDARLANARIIQHQPNLSSSILPGSVNTIYHDNAGICWTGTNNGICYFDQRNKVAEFIPLTPFSDKATLDGMSAAYYDEIDDRYYISSIFSNELFIIDGKKAVIESIKTINGKPLTACTNILADRNNDIWLLTETHIYKYNRNEKKFQLFPTLADPDEPIYHDLILDQQGNYWLASWRNGVYRYISKEKRWQHFGEKDSIVATNITSLLNDPKDEAVWIGTFNYGIYRFDLHSNQFLNYTETDANPDYMQLVLVRDLEKNANGNIWAAMTAAGLYRYTHHRNYATAFDHFTAREGLPNNSFQSIAADDKNRLWILSGKSLGVIDSAGKLLYIASGHPAMRFSNYATDPLYPKRIHYSAARKELLIPVAGGLLIYYPDRNSPSNAFPLVLTDLKIKGNSVLYDSSLKRKNHLRLPYRSNSLSFEFAALLFSGNGNMNYEYKLHETDKDWKSFGNSGILNFPDMSPGKYNLLVRAKDNNGRFSSNIYSYSFSIIPPFWKTIWFYLLVILFVAGLFFLVYRYRLNKKLELERLRLRISRDLHDDIGSALSSINVLSKVALKKGSENSDVNTYLSKINESSSYTMESMSDIVWTINPKNDTMDAMISRMKEFAADVCEARGIDLHFSSSPELESVLLDIDRRKNLFLIFKEAINNAAKYSQCRSIKLELKKNGQFLELIIQDDGIGFDPATIRNGNGLINMRERARESNAALSIESSKGIGTYITLKMPIPRIGVLKKN